MPELPEVETVKSGLNHQIRNFTVRKVWVGWPKIIQYKDGVKGFEKDMVGQSFDHAGRRGKYLVFYWTDYAWLSHLRMEGSYLYVPAGQAADKYCHVVLTGTNEMELRYRDVRKFGRIHMFARSQLDQEIAALDLGPEPNDLSLDYLYPKLKKTSRKIKTVLLDQSVIAGVGNIYADESLFRAGIHPLRPADSLSKVETDDLIGSIQAVITDAVEAGGSSVRTYKNSFGELGRFQTQLMVYNRQGQACYKCGTRIEKIKVNQRGTHFCPHCQH